jgi:hypothetical protein
LAAACYLFSVTRDPLTGETFARVVGRRQRPAFGAAPSLEAQAAHTEEMAADRLRWTVAAMVERARGG